MNKDILEKAFTLMSQAKAMTELYEAERETTSKYVHATSRGHEAVQLALSLQLKPQDWVSPYYRDDSILLGIGMKPYDLMLQLLAKKDDPFSGGRTYYCHPSLKEADKPKIIHQSSATGMQAIPTAGLAMGVQYREKKGLDTWEEGQAPVVVCSIGDAAMTEGEVSEAMQMAALKQLPFLMFVQDNEWDISANAAETRAQDASTYAKGFKGIEVRSLNGSSFVDCYKGLQEVLEIMRRERRPFLVHAKVPLLGHHTSGVRKEWYRDDLEEHALRDPYPVLRQDMLAIGFTEEECQQIEKSASEKVASDYIRALAAPDPTPEDLFNYDYAPTPITEEKGEREPKGKAATVMVDSALFAIQEIMAKHPEAPAVRSRCGKAIGWCFSRSRHLGRKVWRR